MTSPWRKIQPRIWKDDRGAAVIRGRFGWFGVLDDSRTSMSYKLRASAMKWVERMLTSDVKEH